MGITLFSAHSFVILCDQIFQNVLSWFQRIVFGFISVSSDIIASAAAMAFFTKM